MQNRLIVIGVVIVACVYSIGVASARPIPGSGFYKVSRDGRVLVAGGAIITDGTQSEWGYSAYFEDSEGNVWELMAQKPAN